MKLTPKQKAFADNYIENGGNASAAARDAGYRERAAGSMGAENLKKPQIAAYIAERQEKIDSDRICTLKESFGAEWCVGRRRISSVWISPWRIG